MIVKKRGAFDICEIKSNAQTLQTLLECVRREIAVTSIKREMMCSYADFYEGDVRRVEDILYAANKLLKEIEDIVDDVWAAECKEEKTA